jgi:hypothetical protein
MSRRRAEKFDDARMPVSSSPSLLLRSKTAGGENRSALDTFTPNGNVGGGYLWDDPEIEMLKAQMQEMYTFRLETWSRFAQNRDDIKEIKKKLSNIDLDVRAIRNMMMLDEERFKTERRSLRQVDKEKIARQQRDEAVDSDSDSGSGSGFEGTNYDHPADVHRGGKDDVHSRDTDKVLREHVRDLVFR